MASPENVLKPLLRKVKMDLDNSLLKLIIKSVSRFEHCQLRPGMLPHQQDFPGGNFYRIVRGTTSGIDSS